MTTFSESPLSDEPVIPSDTDAPSAPSRATVTATGSHRTDPAICAPYGDPAIELVHAVVSGRPLDEIAGLITVLERSPAHSRTLAEALRAAGVVRPVADVARLAALLTRPPRDAHSADEMIRAAAAGRPIADVTRLVTLLHTEPLAPHLREEALRTAVMGRCVEDLIALMDTLAEEQPSPRPGSPATDPPPCDTGEPQAPPAECRTARRRAVPTPVRPGTRRGARPRRGPRDHGHRFPLTRPGGPTARRTRRIRRPEPAAEPVLSSLTWSSRLAAIALSLCAIAHFPLYADGSSLRAYGFSVALAELCIALALALVLHPRVAALATALVVPAVLATSHVMGPAFPAPALTRVLELALAPPWLAGATALTAALLALASLIIRVASPFPDRHWAAWPAPEGRHSGK